MNTKEFEQTIKIEELARTTAAQKFLLKSYLIMPIGEKSFKEAYLYNGGEVLPEGSAIKGLKEKEIKASKKQLISYFEQICKEGKWTVTTSKETIVTESGDISDIDSQDVVLKETHITQKTYYLNKKRLKEIEEFNFGHKLLVHY